MSSPVPSPVQLPKPDPIYVRFIRSVQALAAKAWAGANKLTGNYVSYLAQAILNFINKGVSEAVVFGYWSVFSLFPLVMLAIVFSTFALGAESAKAQVSATLSQFLPGGGSTLITDNIEQAISQRGSFSLIGIIGLIYGATGLFMNLQFSLGRIFRDAHIRFWPVQLVIGVLMLIVLVLLIIASIVVSGLFTLLGSQVLSGHTTLYHLMVGVGAVIIPLSINTTMFALLFRLVPQRKIVWRALLPAAIIGGIGWELIKNFFGWYVAHLANFGLMYGSLGTVIGLLTWTYLTGCFISLCAEGAVATDDWLAKRAPAVTVSDTNKPADQLPVDAPGKVANIDERATEVQEGTS